MIVPLLSLTTLGLLVAGTFWTMRHVRLTETKYPPAGAFLTVENIRLHYVRRGQGRPLLLVHGGFGSVYDFTLSIFNRLSSRFDTVAIDRPGHGYSTRPRSPVTLFDQARLLQAAIRELNLDKPVIVGHSLGAAVGLALLSDYPNSFAGLVSIGGYVTPFDGPPHPMHLFPAIPVLGSIYLSSMISPFGHLVKDEIGRKVFLPKKPMIDYLDAATALALRPNHFKSNAEDIRRLNAALRELGKRLPSIMHPVAVLSGDQDLVSIPQRHAKILTGLLPHTRMIWLEGIGHQPAFGAPEKVEEAIDWVITQAS